MRIRWTLPAAEDLEVIQNFLRKNYPSFATLTIQTIYKRIRSLKDFPHRGRLGYRDGTRELVLAPLPYLVVYRVLEDAVQILHIHHGSQNWR